MKNIELLQELEKAKVINFINFQRPKHLDKNYKPDKEKLKLHEVQKVCCLADGNCYWKWLRGNIFGYFVYYINPETKEKTAGYKTFCPVHWFSFLFGNVEDYADEKFLEKYNPIMSKLDCNDGIVP